MPTLTYIKLQCPSNEIQDGLCQNHSLNELEELLMRISCDVQSPIGRKNGDHVLIHDEIQIMYT